MDFYYVTSEYDKYARAYYAKQDIKLVICEKCGYSYDSVRAGNYRVYFEGKKLGDFYHAPGCFIGNDRFIDMLEKYGITGYGIGEIDCVGWYDRRKNPIQVDAGYLREVEVRGRCGYMRNLDGTEVKGCENCGHVTIWDEKEVRGLSVPLDTWDGSDIFCFSNWLGVMICSSRLKEACEKEKIKNIVFRPLETFQF